MSGSASVGCDLMSASFAAADSAAREARDSPASTMAVQDGSSLAYFNLICFSLV